MSCKDVCTYHMTAARIQSKWTSIYYGFFSTEVEIEFVDGRCSHVFACAKENCKIKVRRYLDTGDATSTSNLRGHVVKCWGKEVIARAKALGNDKNVRAEFIDKTTSGDISVMLGLKGGKNVSYSHRNHTCAEVRYVHL